MISIRKIYHKNYDLKDTCKEEKPYLASLNSNKLIHHLSEEQIGKIQMFQ